MNKRMILNGAGTYYFTVHGAKNAPLFRSVFEYDYFRNLLSQEENCQLIAYVFSEHQAQWVMHCQQDWQVTLDNLRAEMQELHFKLWHKHQQIISETADVVFVEEDRYLIPLVMEMHSWPVRQGLVASPEVYPWSSDSYYRLDKQPQWLAAQRMLKRLSHQRFNTRLRYERSMQQFEHWDIESAKHHLYQALATNRYLTHFLSRKETSPKFSTEHVIDLRAQAEQLICNLLGAPIEQIRHPRFRRQYYKVEPLTLWLLLQSDCTINQLVRIFDLDEAVIQGWMRSLPNQHPESFLHRIQQCWQEQFHGQKIMSLSEAI